MSLPNLVVFMIGREVYGQMRPKLNVLAIHTINIFGDKMECILGEAPNTCCKIWPWAIDVLEMFCCKWSRGTI